MSASTRPETAEGVALELYYKISQMEGHQKQDREYVLSLFAECLKAAKGQYENRREKEAFGRLSARTREPVF